MQKAQRVSAERMRFKNNNNNTLFSPSSLPPPPCLLLLTCVELCAEVRGSDIAGARTPNRHTHTHAQRSEKEGGELNHFIDAHERVRKQKKVIVRYWNTSTEGRYKRESEEGEEDELELEENKEGPCWGGRGVYPSVDLDGTLLLWNSISCQLCGNVCQMPCDVLAGVYLWLSACLHVLFLICIHLHSPMKALHWFISWMIYSEVYHNIDL